MLNIDDIGKDSLYYSGSGKPAVLNVVGVLQTTYYL
jgi:hypothetical protein